MKIDRNAPILVTGANGFVASHIVAQLLEAGHTVHGTVRNKEKTEKYAHLEYLAERSEGTLKIFDADLLEEGSFAEAMAGCHLVMHTASPFKLNVQNPHTELIEPALRGTENVLNTVNATDTVVRVVLTSSVVAIYGDAIEIKKTEDNIFTEKHWNKTSTENHQPYPYSKTLAERTAWKMTKKNKRWDLVTIHPSFVMGPALNPGAGSASLDTIDQMLSGTFKLGAPPLWFGIVDVRDVAKAHINAGFNPSAKGRYIVSNREGVSFVEMGRALDAHLGEKYGFPNRSLPKWLLYVMRPFHGLSWKYLRRNLGYIPRFDNSRSLVELGIEYRDWVTAVTELGEQRAEDI